MAQRPRRWWWILLILILILLILWLIGQCGENGTTQTNQAPIARNDRLDGCTLSASGSHFSCIVNFPAGTLFNDNDNGADSDPDGDSFTAANAGMNVVGATGDPWSPPGPEARNCNADFLCTTDRNFVPGSSSLTVHPDGSVSLTYASRTDLVGTLIGEFLYRITDTQSNTSDPGYVEVFIH